MVDKSPSGGYNREKQEKSWGDERPGVMIMTKADKYLVEDIKNILENGFQDVDPRPKYEDGTPAHTISVNHVMRKYDLRIYLLTRSHGDLCVYPRVRGVFLPFL